jgi:quinol monooxygenase YgiN
MSLNPQAPTFIAILDLRTAPVDRPVVTSQLESERPVVRAMPGCIDFRVYASSERDTDVTVVHEWIDEASFGAYLESDAFERSGVRLRPLLTAPPVSRRFRVELVESVN